MRKCNQGWRSRLCADSEPSKDPWIWHRGGETACWTEEADGASAAEWRLRVFVDCYEEIMPQEVTKCFETYNAGQQWNMSFTIPIITVDYINPNSKIDL